jgi:hypothetical protein
VVFMSKSNQIMFKMDFHVEYYIKMTFHVKWHIKMLLMSGDFKFHSLYVKGIFLEIILLPSWKRKYSIFFLIFFQWSMCICFRIGFYFSIYLGLNLLLLLLWSICICTRSTLLSVSLRIDFSSFCKWF